MKYQIKKIPPIDGIDYKFYYAETNGNIYSGINEERKKINPHLGGMRKCKYRYVRLSANGKSKNFKIAFLILHTFIGERPIGMQCCHGSRGTSDDSLSNLYYDTPHNNNNRDKIRDGKTNRGEKNGNGKLICEDVLQIRSLKTIPSKKLLAKDYGISESNLYSILARKTWGWV